MLPSSSLSMYHRWSSHSTGLFLFSLPFPGIFRGKTVFKWKWRVTDWIISTLSGNKSISLRTHPSNAHRITPTTWPALGSVMVLISYQILVQIMLQSKQEIQFIYIINCLYSVTYVLKWTNNNAKVDHEVSNCFLEKFYKLWLLCEMFFAYYLWRNGGADLYLKTCTAFILRKTDTLPSH
jgi:hypothetical protein